MRKLFCLIMVLFLTGTASLFSQVNDESTLLTIDGRKISRGEFERIYKKNNTKESQIDQKSLDEYLELFVNFKLKVIEAESLGLDTVESFRKELAGYRKQLANPFLVDKDIDEKLVKEAYERRLFDVRASHILILLDENASPADTLVAWNKVVALRKRVTNGEDFTKLAIETSEDYSVRNNKGDLGYFTVLQMIYPFENAAYSLKVGEVSQPVRTRYGYHLIKLTDKRNAVGEIKAGHIMVMVPMDAKEEDQKNAEAKIREAYAKLKGGESFDSLAVKYSDDKSSAKRGGEIGWFGTGRMVPDFEVAAFGLKNNGDYTEPVRTSFGWHIIKRLDYRPVGTYEELKADLKTKVSKDMRGSASRSSLVEKLKVEYNFKQDIKALNELIKLVDTTIFNGEWNPEKALTLKKAVFSIGDKIYSQDDVARFLGSIRKKIKHGSVPEYVKQLYEKFVEEEIIAYEESRLEKKYPDFRYLMNEYHDGILLFDLTDKMVWSKAVKDSAGLAGFYEKNKTNYMWSKRADVTILVAGNDKAYTEAMKLLAKKDAKGYSCEDIQKMMTKKDSAALRIDNTKLYLQEENANVDKLAFTGGTEKYLGVPEEKKIYVLNKVADPAPKSLAEARGLVTADYQVFLEKEWIALLRAKYKIEVDRSVLSTIK